MQRAAEKVRVNVQLIDARADSHLWAKSYDGDVKDVFAVESEVSQEIADALQAKLSPKEANTLATAPTKDPEAYDLFLKGEYEEREAESSLKAEPFDRAAAFYQASDRPRPEFRSGHRASGREPESFETMFCDASEPSRIRRSGEHGRPSAVALAPDLAEAHIALGLILLLWQISVRLRRLASSGARSHCSQTISHALRYCAGIHASSGSMGAVWLNLKNAKSSTREVHLTAHASPGPI